MYTDHYGFTAAPFQLTPDARFWFPSRTHKKAMAYLGYALAQAEGFVVITGEIGAGKSTLVAHLLATIDPARLHATSIVSTQVDSDDMLRLAAQRLGIATGAVSKAELLDEVERELGAVAASGRRSLLIVDEAQNLSISALEELRMLSNFQSGGRPLIQILLLGQPEFRDRLAASDALEQLRQRVIATHHLDPIGADEVEPYVLHRLKLVGWDGQPAFDGSAFDALYRYSGGVPRRLNQLAHRLVLHASVEELAVIDGDAVDAVASDLSDERAEPSPEAVLPLRSSAFRPRDPEPFPAQAAPEAVRDRGLERRVVALEARLEEQEAALRRVLTLLIDWVENGEQMPAYRDNAA